MTIVKVSKKQLIEAIQKEPATSFEAGWWYNGKKKDCTFCAVGAIMRNITSSGDGLYDQYNAVVNAAEYAVDTEDSRDNVDHSPYKDKKDLEKAAVKLVKQKKYMGAISHYFESLFNSAQKRTDSIKLSRHQLYRIKKDVINFIEQNFPKSIKINIDGAKPAKDVKVVSND